MTAADYNLISGAKDGRLMKPTDRMAVFDPIKGRDVLILPSVSSGGSGAVGITSDERVTSWNTSILTLSAFSVATTDATTSGAGGGAAIYTFPEGVIQVSVVVNLAIARVGTNLTATAAVVSAVGSATAAADATLTSTEADIVASTSTTLTAGAATFQAASTSIVTLNGTASAAKLYLNFATNDAGSGGNDAIAATGTVAITWRLIGDY